MEAPDAIKWLNGLGVEFDKAEDGTMITTHGGGTSRKRMHAAKDYSGSEIMRWLLLIYVYQPEYEDRPLAVSLIIFKRRKWIISLC